MTHADRPEFLERLKAVAQIFDKELTPVVIELYFRALEDFSLADVSLGLSRCVHRSTFMPRPADIRAAIQGQAESRVEAMIAQAREAARRFGYMQQPESLPPTTVRAIRSVFGSWAGFCGADWTTYEQHRLKDALAGIVESEDARPFPELTQNESVALLSSLRARMPIAPPALSAAAVPEPVVPFDEEARLRELRRQAAEITGQGAP